MGVFNFWKFRLRYTFHSEFMLIFYWNAPSHQGIAVVSGPVFFCFYDVVLPFVKLNFILPWLIAAWPRSLHEGRSAWVGVVLDKDLNTWSTRESFWTKSWTQRHHGSPFGQIFKHIGTTWESPIGNIWPRDHGWPREGGGIQFFLPGKIPAWPR